MMIVPADFRDRPFYRLTRHFFGGLFDLGFLSEAGADSFERMIIGICAVFFSFGLLLVRVFIRRFHFLAALDTPEPYRWALLTGEMFTMALPMWIVAFVTILVSHSLFPDETDFRVLMPLPVTQRFIFSAKLQALALFTGLFILATHAAVAPLVLLMSFGRWAGHAWLLRMIAYALASGSASLFAVFAVTAINGLLIVCAPSGRLVTVATAIRSAMLCALVLALPLVAWLPAQGSRLAHGATLLYFAPPAWFLGLERVLLGEIEPYFVRLTQIAVAGLLLGTGIAVGSYTILYRRFDRVMLRPPAGPSSSARRWALPGWRPRSSAATLAIRTFTMITLRRSALHQGIVVCLAAAGFGVVLNGLLSADIVGWLQRGGAPPAWLVGWVVWAPFPLMFSMTLAVRAALVVPIEPRANWIFRMTEPLDARRDQLRAAVQTVRRLGVILPLALTLPLQWAVLGRSAGLALAADLLCGFLFVEILMSGWQRIPFTCSYIPGKRFVPQSLLIGFVAFVLFTTIGYGVVQLSRSGRPGALVPNALLLGETLWLRRRRLINWTETPLAFEDQVPAEIQLLHLTAD
jgi:hypothetical protein